MRLCIFLAMPLVLLAQSVATVTEPVAIASIKRKETELEKAVREFQVQTRNLGLRPEAPGIKARAVRRPLKYHGRVYENLRNDFLDSIPHEVRQRGSDKNLLRRNQFGFNLAGPVYIPKLYNGVRSTFFSVSYEGLRERISRSYLRTVATQPERSGDFSTTVDGSGNPLAIYDPASTRLNPDFNPGQPVSVGNLQYLRDPFPGNKIPASRLDPAAVRIVSDLPVANTDRGPYFRNNYFAVNPETNTANGMIFKLDHSLTPKQRLQFSTAFSNGYEGSARVFDSAADPNPADRTFSSREGSVQHTWTLSPRIINTLDITAESSGSQSEGDVYSAIRFTDYYAPMGRSNPRVRSVRNRFSVTEGLSVRQGSHSLRFSTYWLHDQYNVMTSVYPDGVFRFGPSITGLPGITNTGYPFASFLLGLAEQAEQSVVLSPSYFRRNYFSLTASDRWEMRSNLSFSGSVRFEVTTPRTEKYDRQSTVDLGKQNPVTGTDGAMIVAGVDGQGRGFQPIRVTLEPSASVAWTPAGRDNTVVRANYSRAYSSLGLSGGQWATQAFNAYPVYISSNLQLEPAVTLSGGLPAPPIAPNTDPAALNGLWADLVDMSDRLPRIQTAEISLQKQLPGDVVVTSGMYHQDGKNMVVGSEGANVNAIPLDALSYRDELNEEAFRSTLRPYPQYLGFDLNDQYPVGRYQRDAGYVRLEKRSSGGLGLSAYYEFGKQLDDYSGPYGIQDVYNRDNNWSLTAGSRPHRLSLSYMYELPLGPTHGILGYTDWRRYLIEGWSLSGMTNWYSGTPLALRAQFNNTGKVVEGLTVNEVPGVDPNVSQKSPEMWFNPAAFVQPDDFTVGAVSRTHPTLRGPISQNHDLSLNKRFTVAADQTVELSANAFNFINHANWIQPDTVIGPASAPNANAGKIIESRGGRVIQVGLRFSF